MPLTFTPKQMDALVDGTLAGYTRVSNVITDHEDDGRLFRHLTFTDPQGQTHQFNYLWSPWDGNDYAIFATAEDEVQVKATPALVVAPPIASPPVAAPRVITHTLAEVKHQPEFQVAIVEMYRMGKFGTPVITLAEAKTRMRAIAERFGVSDRDVIDAVHDPRKACGIQPPKTLDEPFTPQARRARRRPG